MKHLLRRQIVWVATAVVIVVCAVISYAASSGYHWGTNGDCAGNYYVLICKSPKD